MKGVHRSAGAWLSVAALLAGGCASGRREVVAPPGVVEASAPAVAAGLDPAEEAGTQGPAALPEPESSSPAPPEMLAREPASSDFLSFDPSTPGLLSPELSPLELAAAEAESETLAAAETTRRRDWRATEAERQALLEVGPCRVEPPTGETALDKTRRRLYQTVCGAALWLDGLFGPQQHVEAARGAHGRVELGLTDSGYWGFDERTKFAVRVRLPNLENRVEAFVGRDDDRDILYDRNEAFAIGSQFSSLERDERWVLGLGYGLPGSYARRTDFRVGVKGGREPEIYTQGRLRRNWFVGDRTLFHFRDTVFWTNREGFGNTASFDVDRVLTPHLLMRWSVLGTYGQETSGVDYRVYSIWYQNLSTSGRAIAYEVFARGETDDEVALEEYGLQTVFRRPLGGRDWLFGELTGGYTFVRESLQAKREGSYLVGFGIELLFGQGNRYKP